jgi:FtsZ-binding cell division protein ZapB
MNIITDLEDKVNRAVDLIADLKKRNTNLKEENDSLKGRLEDLRVEFERYKTNISGKIAESSGSRSDFNVEEVKKRLSKLAGKLAALEDSWI